MCVCVCVCVCGVCGVCVSKNDRNKKGNGSGRNVISKNKWKTNKDEHA